MCQASLLWVDGEPPADFGCLERQDLSTGYKLIKMVRPMQYRVSALDMNPARS
jgi:hypothetical protein